METFPQSQIIAQRPAFLEGRKRLWAQFQRRFRGTVIVPDNPHFKYLLTHGTPNNIRPALGETNHCEEAGEIRYVVEGYIRLPRRSISRLLRRAWNPAETYVGSFKPENCDLALELLTPDQRIAVMQFVYAQRLERLQDEYDELSARADYSTYDDLVKLMSRMDNLARYCQQNIHDKCYV